MARPIHWLHGNHPDTMPGIVLTYHSMNVLGNAYGDNDHVALAADLRMLDAAGWRIVPLGQLVDAWEADALDRERLVALTFDDGGALDARDVIHPSCGPQEAFLTILRAFRAEAGARQPELHASSFVIASPEARAELDRKDFLGLGWWDDGWWREASDSGLIAIESHSWDHNHPSLSRTAMDAAGRFDTLATADEAEAEFVRASDYIAATCGRRPRFFAWPWGQVSAWARDHWLPQHAERIGLRAAFSTEPVPLDARSHRFALPRYVCGEHWRAPAGLAALLQAAAHRHAA